MDNTDKLKEKYLHSPEFNALVNMIQNFMITSKYGPQDIRDATFIASLRISESMRFSDFWPHTEFEKTRRGDE